METPSKCHPGPVFRNIVTFRLISPRCMSLSLFLKVHRQLPISRNIFRCISASQISSSNSATRPSTTANTTPSSTKPSSNNQSKTGKKKSNTPGKELLLLPTPPSPLGIVDTHTHLATTYSFYRPSKVQRGETRECVRFHQSDV